MTGPSLLTAAVDELYAAPLAEFIARRKTLAAAARKVGDRVAATAIGALRKPSLSADTVNRLVHGAPDEVGELLQLGADLRTAEQALDAGELRRLSERRRRLVHDLAELAFELTGQTSPSAAVRDEVTATLNAALADEEVAQRLSSGALVTQARWDGFGSTQLPELAASMADLPLARLERVAKSDPDREGATPPAKPPPPAKPAPPAPPAERDTAETATAAAEVDPGTKAPVRRTEQQRARDKRAAAKQAQEEKAAAAQAAARQAAADEAAEAAATAAAQVVAAQELVSTIDRRISELNLQLAHQRQLLADAQRALKAAENQRRVTALAATRAGAGGR